MEQSIRQAAEQLAVELGIGFSVSGRINTPGKFENERVYVLYFWDMYLNGFSDASTDDAEFFELTEEEQKELGTRKQYAVLTMWENGFVSLGYCDTI